jgi:ribonuclease R
MDFETTETKIVCDIAGRIERIVPRTRNDAHKLIEECMLAANTSAADFLARSKHPALYRIHEGPTPEKLALLREFLQGLGFSLGGGDDPSPADYAALATQIGGRPDTPLLQTMLLRSMQQAIYSPYNSGHFGLSYPSYTHFTSPIRRYPDLTIHRQLTRWKRTGKASYDETELMFLGEHCSGMERRAALAERDLVKVKLLEFMSKQLGEHKMAIITGVAEYGFFAQIVDLPVEGMVHITTLNDDNYLFDAESHSLTGLKYKRRFRLGDKIEVEIAKVDIVKKQMDLRPVIAMEEQKKKPNRK